MRGILMIEPLYHQAVKELKTQTRRSGGLDEVNENPDNWEITGHTGDDNEIEVIDFCDYRDTLRNIYLKPRYKIGEVLYVKEPYTDYKRNIGGKDFTFFTCAYDMDQTQRHLFKFKNKLFMPEKYAKVFVQITGIRCERLLDISDEDCIAEGINMPYGNGHRLFTHPKYGNSPSTTKQSFIDLYRFANNISAKKEIGNPWVFCYELQLLPDYKL